MDWLKLIHSNEAEQRHSPLFLTETTPRFKHAGITRQESLRNNHIVGYSIARKFFLDM